MMRGGKEEETGVSMRVTIAGIGDRSRTKKEAGKEVEEEEEEEEESR